MASRRIIALKPGSKTEKQRGVDDGDEEDRYQGGN